MVAADSLTTLCVIGSIQVALAVAQLATSMAALTNRKNSKMDAKKQQGFYCTHCCSPLDPQAPTGATALPHGSIYSYTCVACGKVTVSISDP